MKTILFCIIMLLGISSSAQYKIDQAVAHTFDSVLNLQPNVQQEREYWEQLGGLGYLLQARQDTLNREDYVPVPIDTSVKSVAIDPDTGKPLPPPVKDTTRALQRAMCRAVHFGDTLGLGCGVALFSGYGFGLKLTGTNLSVEYYEYADTDSIFRLALADPPSSSIQVGGKAENVVLSGLPHKTGDVVYGKATLVVDPFYIASDHFKQGYMRVCYTFTYLFKCKLE